MSEYNEWNQRVQGSASGSDRFDPAAAEFVPSANAAPFQPYGQFSSPYAYSPYGQGYNQGFPQQPYGQYQPYAQPGQPQAYGQQPYAQQPYVPAVGQDAQAFVSATQPDVADDWESAEAPADATASSATEVKTPVAANEAGELASAVEKVSIAPEVKPTETEAPKPVVISTTTAGDADKNEKEKEDNKAKEAAASSDNASAQAEETPAAVEEEEEEEEDDTTDLPAELEDKREHLNIVFIGHVDAGKSTIGGHLMYLTGNVDKRTLEKYEREAREKNRESWYLSWAMDTNDEERAKGKTVECGQGHFTTENKHFTVIDAPGHKSFVPNMISGAAQADVAVLVISARKGEFETGFDRGGQTREHAMLAKTAGVRNLIVVVNKMDDSTVNWDQSRFDEITQKLTPFLRQTGFKKEEITFIPVSGLKGTNLTEEMDDSVCSWYNGPALVPFLDTLPKIARLLDHPFRMPITDKYKDMGVIVMGKIQSGYVKKGQKVLIMPNKDKVDIDTVWADDEEVDVARSGDNVKLKLKNVDEENVASGHVLCLRSKPCSVCTCFDAQLFILDWKSIICPGFNAVLHIHSATEEVHIKGFICHINKKTGKADKEKGRPRFVKQGDVCIARLQCAGAVCLETFKEHPHMGRFTLRDEGQTLAIGKVMKLIDPRE